MFSPERMSIYHECKGNKSYDFRIGTLSPYFIEHPRLYNYNMNYRRQ